MTANGKSSTERGPSVPDLLGTGVRNLDRVLGGGIRARSLTMIMGAPGAGKTMLAQQVAFHAAEHNHAALYLTGYSETHDKLLENSRGLSFFNPASVGREIQFLSLAELLREGPAETEEAIVDAARTHAARLVVLDGFRSMRRFLAGDQEIAHFMYSLGAKLALLGATTLTCLEGDPLASSHDPELTVCDTILSLRREVHGAQERRLLEVLKVRGAAPLAGLHPYTIDNDGITVYPRWESIVVPQEPPWSGERFGFGIPGFDDMLGGGLTAQTTTLVAGSPGVGKTLLGLHFLSAAQAEQPALYVGFTEDRAQLHQRSRVFGLHLEEAEAAGQLRLAILPGYDLEADRIAAFIAQDVERRGVRRLMIDSLAEVERGVADPQRRADFLSALVTYLRNQNVTTYITLDINTILSPTLEFTNTPLSILAENLIVLRYAEYGNRLHQLLSVLKMRFSDYDPSLHEYRIRTGHGIELLGPAPAAVGLLPGIVQPVAGDLGPPPSERER
ncbi:MAG: ATPase domain-containing protein [Chloroflexota bacterium]